MASTNEAPFFGGTFLEKGEDGQFRLFRIDDPRKGLRKKPGSELIPETPEFSDQVGSGEHIVILGAGVGGLALAYQILKSTQYKVTILEALDRFGGRSLTLRHGDSFTEVMEVDGKETPITQTCLFEEELGQPYPTYLNAGPGRIPSGHINVLNYCRELAVDLEVYVMESRSNRFYSDTGFGNFGDMQINRRVANDTRGHIAAMVYDSENGPEDKPETPLQQLMLSFGDLEKEGEERGKYTGSTRSGYIRLPGVHDGPHLPPVPLPDLLKSEFWNHSFYQPDDWLWQATSFQPVGGMDMIEKAFAKAIEFLMDNGRRGELKLGCPVKKVSRTATGFDIEYENGSETETISATQCASNIPIPLLEDKIDLSDFSPEYAAALQNVFDTNDFLRPTCKVGWQAERRLWQNPPNSRVNPVIPIFGGISYTSDEMHQMWYPSNQYHARLGILTGAYNYNDVAERWGKLLPEERLDIARDNVVNLHGKEFSDQLYNGVSIAWQNIPTQKGGWVDWEKLPENVQAVSYNELLKQDRGFYIVGDQVSDLPGWKEGAIASAINVFAQVSKVVGFAPLQFARVPSTRALVEGIVGARL